MQIAERYSDEYAAELVADFELSERLGAEILALGAGEPANTQAPKGRNWYQPVRKVNLVTGESSVELERIAL